MSLITTKQANYQTFTDIFDKPNARDDFLDKNTQICIQKMFERISKSTLDDPEKSFENLKDRLKEGPITQEELTGLTQTLNLPILQAIVQSAFQAFFSVNINQLCKDLHVAGLC